jgi:hypothetical protein
VIDAAGRGLEGAEKEKPQAVGYTGYGGRLATVPAISLVA